MSYIRRLPGNEIIIFRRTVAFSKIFAGLCHVENFPLTDVRDISDEALVNRTLRD